ncbi:metallophosphoesterase [Alkaliphilus hydrothermalis]|uniref:Phosphohydrolase n=1 Tax=Alkaliphilus hydrothermalis TaxID=1482730 RepID=A0ABS2NTS6_9FIRM|nr:metallophosphoesterase [Alkaliphilus hydrothermalis]MBM7616336.1 putative phosphohydrolase [Alkaliphilus hydrothermalis]
MALYAIADLHLSGSVDKPMDVFGEHWYMHHQKIREKWLEKIQDMDTVLIAGDISWGMKLEEALVDLSWIHQLPGRKILIRGNHDYWWASITKLNQLFDGMDFIQNNFFTYGDYAICGTRGWTCPNPYKYTEQDEKIYIREGLRLEASIEKARKAGFRKFIVMLHYPPTNDHFEPSIFTEILEKYQVEKVVYGHLHGEDSYEAGIQGLHRDVEYNLVSCDYLNFDLVKLL